MRKIDESKHAEKRMHVLAAARTCFLRSGFHGASISDICAEAGMSPGHLYHYFQNKEAIIAAIVEMGIQQAGSLFDQLADEADIVDSLATRIAERLKSAHQSGKASLVVEIMAEAARNPAIAEVLRRRDVAIRTGVSKLLRQGQKQGRVDPTLDPDAAASMLIAIVECIILRAAREPDFAKSNSADTLKLLITRFLVPGPKTPAAKVKKSAQHRVPRKTGKKS